MKRIARREFCGGLLLGLSGAGRVLGDGAEAAVKETSRDAKGAGILQLRLQTHRLAEVRAFYRDTLHFPVREESAGSVTFQAGATSLTFIRAPDEESRPFYHFAFNIPENKLSLAQAWLAERTPLVTRATGPVFHFPGWNAHAIYFYDPAGNIGELIARHDLPNARSGPFTIDDILYASEIGLVVKDVPAATRALKAQLGLSPYRPGSAEFAPVGDEHRLLIVVREGRLWFGAENGKPAAIFPTEATLHGGKSNRSELEGYPYALRTRPG
jgi:catechol-2,3-dioxygenase